VPTTYLNALIWQSLSQQPSDFRRTLGLVAAAALGQSWSSNWSQQWSSRGAGSTTSVNSVSPVVIDCFERRSYRTLHSVTHTLHSVTHTYTQSHTLHSVTHPTLSHTPYTQSHTLHSVTHPTLSHTPYTQSHTPTLSHTPYTQSHILHSVTHPTLSHTHLFILSPF